MSEETNQAQVGTQESSATEDTNKVWDSPLLSRNADKEGVPPEAPKEEVPEVKAPAAPENKEENQEPKSEVQVKADAINMLDSFSDDPQFKPIAMYLDKQLEGIDTDRAFGKALSYGDTNLIDQAYLTEKLGDRAGEIVNLATSLFEAASAKATAQVNSIHQEFGGPDVVNQAIKFFNEKGDAVERKALGALLDSGVKENIQYAMNKIVSFSKQAGGIAAKGSVIPVGQPSAERGLSKDEYREAVRALTSRPGRPSDAEFEKLANARKLGVQQGI